MTTNSPRAYVVLQTAKTKKFVFTGKRFLGNSSIFVSIAIDIKRTWLDFVN